MNWQPHLLHDYCFALFHPLIYISLWREPYTQSTAFDAATIPSITQNTILLVPIQLNIQVQM